MITGFIIVRNFLFEENYSGSILNPIDHIYYQGLNRSMWMDIEDYFSANSLSHIEVQKKYNLNDNGNFIKVIRELQFADLLINLNNEIRKKNEIIVISSPYLNKIEKETKIEKPITWLGYDIVLLGGWSLLRHGIFENKMFSLMEKSTTINKFGLFNNLDYTDKFIQEYNHLSSFDLVDPLIDELPLDFVRIGKIKE